MKNYWEFINEEKGNIDNISFDIDQTQTQSFEDYDTDVEDWIEEQVGNIGLKSGKIIFYKDAFSVEGVDTDGNHIDIKQKGEYDSYGGPYTPKMNLPIFTVNGIDVYPIVKKAFIDKGYVESDNEVDMTRTDIYPWKEIDKFIDMPEDKRQNLIQSYGSVKKYDL